MIKKYFYAIIFTLLTVSQPALAGGLTYPGNVQIRTSGNRIYMTGDMNVNYNKTVPGSPYVYSTSFVGKVSFYGRDSNGTTFSCFIADDDPKYNEAVEIKSNLRNGSRLIAYIDTTANDNKCLYLGLGNYSYYLD